ncbi:MAG: class I SAM-dependent methyltransferase [Gemmataceae bacterium]
MRSWLILLTTALMLAVPALSQDANTKKDEATKNKSDERYTFKEEHDPNGIGKFYMGREIAHVMGHQAAGWLERKEREREERPSALLKALNIREGDKVADIGAGSGYFTFRLAKLVGAKGKVYAVDIQQEMLDIMKKRMAKEKVTNVELIKGTETDPKLPVEGALDLVLMVDVYHEFSFPWEMTGCMVNALKPGGRLVFVEYRMEDPKVPIKLVHKMSQAQVKKEMESFRVTHRQTIDVLPWQHIIIFEKNQDN